MKLLPSNSQGKCPDDKCPERVKDFACRGTQFAGYGDTSKVEQSDGERCKDKGKDDDSVVSDLGKAINSIFQKVIRIVTPYFANLNVSKRNQ